METHSFLSTPCHLSDNDIDETYKHIQLDRVHFENCDEVITLWHIFHDTYTDPEDEDANNKQIINRFIYNEVEVLMKGAKRSRLSDKDIINNLKAFSKVALELEKDYFQLRKNDLSYFEFDEMPLEL
eukprot:Pgem_evm1s3784